MERIRYRPKEDVGAIKPARKISDLLVLHDIYNGAQGQIGEGADVVHVSEVVPKRQCMHRGVDKITTEGDKVGSRVADSVGPNVVDTTLAGGEWRVCEHPVTSKAAD